MVKVLEEILRQPLDVLVIGGGIVGSGVARDAAMRGLRVGLVDKRDFAFGTSSRSSRLLHGGLRYLAQGRIGLVREASVEKVILHRIAPHLAMPLPFVFPTYAGTDWKLWKLRIGVKMYDLLCSGRNLGKSHGMTRQEVLKEVPGLNQDGLTGAVRYFDGMTNDARLVIDTLRSAEQHGALLANYVTVASADRDGESWKCTTDSDEEIRTKWLINAAGAWANKFAASRVALRVTKGVHLVISAERLRLREAVVMSQGKRILFAIPWGERVILGTTDTDYAGSLDDPPCGQEDVQYILDVTNRSFPAAKLKMQDVISTWAGLRPLIADPNRKPSDISRRHLIQMTEPGWIDVAGGKLTTYRLMAEQTVDLIAPNRECTTDREPILKESPRFSGILPPEVTRDAVDHYCRHEWAQHLDDVMIRRTSWRYYHADHQQIAEKVAAWMSEIHGWDEPRAAEELNAYYQRTGRDVCGIAEVTR